ncbi:NmrA family NAD(P)-binding protein [Spongisporangium articulatum]|uniref:NmrA family NAD(P)-binding protein n=1 Tax=Spongisporangium articulatum TaxID=3362603 RepID=A0ABW8AK53_9ACTN
MSLVVTAASGHLGRLVLTDLLARGTDPGRIVAGARNPLGLAEFAAQGVDVRHLDYTDPTSVTEALEGAERVLIISGTDFGPRVAQHVGVAEAAQKAGASRVAYTSGPYAQTSSMLLMQDHANTERGIEALDIPHTFLRNSWYHENYTAQLGTYLEHGVAGAAQDGRISGAPRADYAAAAATVLLDGEATGDHVYELGGDTAFTLTELAETISKVSGREVGYTDLGVEGFKAMLQQAAGMPEPVAGMFADVDRAIAQGALFVDSGDLAKLIGRPTGSLEDAVRAALAELDA